MNREQFEQYAGPLLEGLTFRDAWAFLTDLFLLCSSPQNSLERMRALLRERRWDLAVREAAESTGMALFTDRQPLTNVSTDCFEITEHILNERSKSPGMPPEALSDLLDCLLWKMVQRRLIRDFITPAFLADMMVQMLEPWPDCSILDPACGSGGLLLAAKKRCPGSLLTGIEINRSIAAAAALRLLINGGTAADVQAEDFFRLAAGMEDRWDMVLSNPPYDHDLSDTAHFIGGFLKVLKPGGRCAVLVPEGFLSSTVRAKANAVRRILLQYHTLEAVISLPPEIYAPQIVSHSSLLVFRKGRDEIRRDVFFSRVFREEENPGEAGAYLPSIGRVLDAWKNWSAGELPPGPEEPGPVWWTVSHEALAQGGSIFPAEGGRSASPYAAIEHQGEALRQAEERQSALESLLRRYIGGTE